MATKRVTDVAEVEGLSPHFALRHADLRDFWERCMGQEEVSWDTFWLHFPTGLAPEVLVDSSFSSQKERTAFQDRLYVVGAPEHVNVSMLDAAFPPGCPIGVTIARLMADVEAEKRLSEAANLSGRHRPLGLQSSGFWDEAPAALPSLAGLSAEVEAELSFADGQRTTVAQVLGHVGSGAASAAVEAGARLVAKGFWSSAVHVGMKGASTAEMAAARVAGALNILSYPVLADELLRLTAFFHSRADAGGRTGIILDAEGCTRADELNALSVLATTVAKAGRGSVQILVAGEGALQLSSSIRCTTLRVLNPGRNEGKAFVEANVRGDYLGSTAAGVSTACGHQATLLRLAVASLQTGKVSPDALVTAICAALPSGADSAKSDGQPAEAVVCAILDTLAADEREAVYRLSVLPTRFTVAAANKVLGHKQESDALQTLTTLAEKGFLRTNMASALFGMPAGITAAVRMQRRTAPAAASFEAAVIALVEYSLELAETAAALNASNAQIAAMRVIDREREVLDEMVNLLQDCRPLPAVTITLYGELVSKHMDLLGFRLSVRQQQELCTACARASRAEGDTLAEARCLQHLGQIGNIQAADAAMGRAMSTVEKALTPSHPVIADMLLSWARLQEQAGNYQQAERLLRKSLDLQLNHGHFRDHGMAVVATQTRLAGVLIAQSSPDRARPYLQASVNAAHKLLGPRHPDTALAQCRLASCLADLREYEAAHRLYATALDGWRESLGHCHPQFATLLGQLAFCCCRLQKPDDAEQYYRRSIQMWKEMMVLDQQELQDDLRALSDLLQARGKTEVSMEIREQLYKLVEAVRAARTRTMRKAEPRRSLKKALLLPLKALCLPTHRAPAFIALPSGIQDSDLEELRKSAKAQEPMEVSPTIDSTARPGVEVVFDKEEVGSAVSEDHPEVENGQLESMQTVVVNGGTEGPEAALHIKDMEKHVGDLMAPLETPTLQQSLGDNSDDTPSGSARAAKSAPRPERAVKEISTLPSAVAFGSKGRGPTAVEGSAWAASLRNPAVSAASAAKRASTMSSTRNDSSGTKNRLFSSANDARRRGGKASGGMAKSSALGHTEEVARDDLIRAHTVEEKHWSTLSRQPSNARSEQGSAGRRVTFTSDSGYATDDTLDDSAAHLQMNRSGLPDGEMISQVNQNDPAVQVGKNVIGFFNPMFAQYGVSRSSSQATMLEGRAVDEKAEI